MENTIKLKLEDNGNGAFTIEKNTVDLAKMVVRIEGNNLTVFHTEVSDELQGQGIATKLLNTMVDYARRHKLNVIALCPFVSAQFKRHQSQYADVWHQHWHS